MPGRKRHLQAEVERLGDVVADIGVRERDELRAEVGTLQQELPRIRNEHAGLLAALGPLRAEAAPLAAQRGQVVQVQAELKQLRAQRAALGAASAEAERLTLALAKLRADQAELAGQVVETRETAILQEAGIYQYRHPLQDAIAYKAKLAGSAVPDQGRREGGVGGPRGDELDRQRVIRERRQDGPRVLQADAPCLQQRGRQRGPFHEAVHPGVLDSEVREGPETITSSAGTMNIMVTDSYHRLRVEELELTADYLAKIAEQKEREREERARLREEQIARREYEREQERLRKELAHYQTAITALRDRGDVGGADQAEAKLTEIQDALDGITRRAANIRAGHVYVISNIGAFGEDIVKIGMTRRLDPMDRIRELGDASVPFRYDVHAMVFSDDAVGLETHLHHQLADQQLQPGQPAPGVLPRPPRRSPRHHHPPGRLHRRMDRRTRSPRMETKRNNTTPANLIDGEATAEREGTGVQRLTVSDVGLTCRGWTATHTQATRGLDADVQPHPCAWPVRGTPGIALRQAPARGRTLDPLNRYPATWGGLSIAFTPEIAT